MGGAGQGPARDVRVPPGSTHNIQHPTPNPICENLRNLRMNFRFAGIPGRARGLAGRVGPGAVRCERWWDADAEAGVPPGLDNLL